VQRSPLAKVYAPLGDGELSPKPLTFGAKEKEDGTPSPSGKNILSSFLSGKTTRLGDDFAPQEPLQVFMADVGDGEEKGEPSGMYSLLSSWRYEV
jgi:hypothetical protein